jgi:hypothetical protein
LRLNSKQIAIDFDYLPQIKIFSDETFENIYCFNSQHAIQLHGTIPNIFFWPVLISHGVKSGGSRFMDYENARNLKNMTIMSEAFSID